MFDFTANACMECMLVKQIIFPLGREPISTVLPYHSPSIFSVGIYLFSLNIWIVIVQGTGAVGSV